MKRNSYLHNNVVFLNNRQFHNAFCCPLLCHLAKTLTASELCEFIDEVYYVSGEEILESLGLTLDDYAKILFDYFVDLKNQNVTSCKLLVLDFETADFVVKQFNIKYEIILRSCDFNKSCFDLCGVYCDPFYDSDERMNELSMAFAKTDKTMMVNLYDNLEKTGEVSKRYNMSPMQYLESLGVLERNCELVNLAYAEKDDFQIMQDYSVKAVLTPFDSMNFGQGCCKLYSLFKNNIKIKIASPIQNNLQKELEIAQITTRAEMRDLTLFEDEELYQFIKGDF